MNIINLFESRPLLEIKNDEIEYVSTCVYKSKNDTNISLKDLKKRKKNNRRMIVISLNSNVLLIQSVEEDNIPRYWRFPWYNECIISPHSMLKEELINNKRYQITCMTFSPEGDWLVSVTSSSTVHIIPIINMINNKRRELLIQKLKPKDKNLIYPNHNYTNDSSVKEQGLSNGHSMNDIMRVEPSKMRIKMTSFLRPPEEFNNGAKYKSKMICDQMDMSFVKILNPREFGMPNYCCWWRTNHFNTYNIEKEVNILNIVNSDKLDKYDAKIKKANYVLIGSTNGLITMINVEKNKEDCRCELADASDIIDIYIVTKSNENQTFNEVLNTLDKEKEELNEIQDEKSKNSCKQTSSKLENNNVFIGTEVKTWMIVKANEKSNDVSKKNIVYYKVLLEKSFVVLIKKEKKDLPKKPKVDNKSELNENSFINKVLDYKNFVDNYNEDSEFRPQKIKERKLEDYFHKISLIQQNNIFFYDTSKDKIKNILVPWVKDLNIENDITKCEVLKPCIVFTDSNIFEYIPKWNYKKLEESLYNQEISIKEAAYIGKSINVNAHEIFEVVADKLCLLTHDIKIQKWIKELYINSTALPSKCLKNMIAQNYFEEGLCYINEIENNNRVIVAEKKSIANYKLLCFCHLYSSFSIKRKELHEYLEINSEYDFIFGLDLFLKLGLIQEILIMSHHRNYLKSSMKQLVREGYSCLINETMVKYLVQNGYSDFLLSSRSFRVVLRQLDPNIQFDIIIGSSSPRDAIAIHRDWILRSLCFLSMNNCKKIVDIMDPSAIKAKASSELINNKIHNIDGYTDISCSEIICSVLEDEHEIYLTVLLHLYTVFNGKEIHMIENEFIKTQHKYRPNFMLMKCQDYNNRHIAALIHEKSGDKLGALTYRLNDLNDIEDVTMKKKKILLLFDAIFSDMEEKLNMENMLISSRLLSRLLLYWIEIYEIAELEKYFINEKSKFECYLCPILINILLYEDQGQSKQEDDHKSLLQNQLKDPADINIILTCQTVPFSGWFLLELVNYYVYNVDKKSNPLVSNKTMAFHFTRHLSLPDLYNMLVQNLANSKKRHNKEINNKVLHNNRILVKKDDMVEFFKLDDPLEETAYIYSCGHIYSGRLFCTNIILEFDKRLSQIFSMLKNVHGENRDYSLLKNCMIKEYMDYDKNENSSKKGYNVSKKKYLTCPRCIYNNFKDLIIKERPFLSISDW